MERLLLVIYIIFILLGPKIGVIDLSVVVPICIFPLLFKKKTTIPRGFINFTLMICLLICFQFIVQAINNNFSFVAIGRLVRAGLSAVFVGFLFGKNSGHAQWKDYIKIFVAIAAIHSLLVIAGAVFPPIAALTSIMIDGDRLHVFRSPGLMAGYDIAGTFAILGLLTVTSLRHTLYSKTHTFLFVTIFLGACVFTSRLSLAVGLLICGVWILRLVFDRQTGVVTKMAIVTVASLAFIGAAYYFILVLSVTFSMHIIDINASTRSGVISRFAAQDSDGFLWSNMFFMPDSPLKQIFGTGAEPGNSDVGYVREIYRYGIFGLVFAIFSHFTFIANSRVRRFSPDRRGGVFIVYGCMVLILFLSLKNNYIFVRSIFPAFLLLVGAIGYKDEIKGNH